MNRHPLLSALLVSLVRLVSGVRAQGSGTAHGDAPTIFYANHSSHLDAVVIWAALPAELRQRVRPVAALDYWDRSRLRRFIACEVLNAILIDRERNAHGTIDALADALATHSLIFFPEGTRGNGVDVGSFRSGLYHLTCRRPEAQLVPVYLQNLSRILPKGEMLPVPLLGSATFGESLALVPEEPKQSFLTRARQALVELNPETQSC